MPVQDKFRVFARLLGHSHRRIGNPPDDSLQTAARLRAPIPSASFSAASPASSSRRGSRSWRRGFSGCAIDDLTTGVTVAKLALYGSLLLGIGVVGGVFRFLMRRILTGASRDIEYDMRNDFFAHLQTLPLSYFQAHRTGDLMSRATNDLNAVRMMIGPSVMYAVEHGPRPSSSRSALMIADRRAVDAAGAHPAAVRVDFGQVFRQRDSQAVRADSGAAVRGERGGAGSAVRRPRGARVPAGGGRDRAVPPRRTRSTSGATAS